MELVFGCVHLYIPYCNLTRQWGSPILGWKYGKVSRNGGCLFQKNTRFTQRLKFDVSCWPLRPWRAATHAQLEAGLLFRSSSGKGSAHDQKVMVELCMPYVNYVINLPHFNTHMSFNSPWTMLNSYNFVKWHVEAAVKLPIIPCRSSTNISSEY